jgi:hypothetical protein
MKITVNKEVIKMNKKIALILFFCLIGNVFAVSQLTLQINELSFIQATQVIDDDDSIAFVDVFIVNEQGTTQHSFINVIEGQQLIGINENETAYYNFMDDDGLETGMGFLIPITGIPINPPATPKITVIENARITPTVYDEENALYELLIETDVNEFHSLNSIEWIYSIQNGLQNQSIELTGGPKTFSGKLMNLTEKNIISSKIKAIDFTGKTHEFNIGERIFNLMKLNPFCNDEEFYDLDGDGLFTCIDVECLFNYVVGLPVNPVCKNINEYSSAIEDGIITAGDAQRMFYQVCPYGTCIQGECIVEGTLKEKKLNEKIFFQGTGQSFIQLKFTDEMQSNVYASNVFDDDGMIEQVDVYFDDGQGINQNTYFNVSQGQELNLSIPLNSLSYYSFSDSDGSIIGIGFFLQIFAADAPNFCELYPEHPSCVPLPKLIESAKLTARLNEEERKYYLDAEVKVKEEYEMDWVKIEYDFFNKNYFKTLELNEYGTLFIGTLGPFDSELITFAKARAKSNEITDSKNITPRWDYLLLGMFDCEEENPLLPQLYPRIINSPGFVLIENYFDIEYAIGNAGAIDANSFQFKTIWNEEIKKDERINSLTVNESKFFEENIYAGNTPGKKTFTINVDYLNEVIESNETDNVLNTIIWVRLNQFDVNYNYNNTYFLGDLREINLKDLFKKNVENAECEIIYPSGKTIKLISDNKGIIKFTLIEGGIHTLKASKEKFENFEGRFEIESIKVGYKKELETGDVQLIQLKTIEGKTVSNAEITIISPSGKTIKLETNEKGQAFFAVQEKGTHVFIIKRKDVSFFNSKFESLTLMEQVSLIMTNFIEVTAGTTLIEWILFLMLLALSAYAGKTTFTKLKSKIKKGSTREMKQQMVLFSIIAGTIFILPITVKILIGIEIALAVALIEITAILFSEYYEKQKEKTKKIKVE